jgi:hypothetical protein
MLLPGVAALGPDLVMPRSAEVPPLTKVVAALLLFSSFGSNVAFETVAMLVKKVPGGVAEGICVTSVKFALWPDANAAFVQVTVPPFPAPGSVHRKAGPLFCVRLTKVMPGGIGSPSCALKAASGPMFVTVIE